MAKWEDCQQWCDGEHDEEGAWCERSIYIYDREVDQPEASTESNGMMDFLHPEVLTITASASYLPGDLEVSLKFSSGLDKPEPMLNANLKVLRQLHTELGDFLKSLETTK